MSHDWTSGAVTRNDAPMLDDRHPIPVYVRLASILREQIVTGILPAGGAVPSEQHLADEYGVSRQTARAAVTILRDEGWVVTRRSRGSTVVPVPEPRVITAGRGARVSAYLAADGNVTLVVTHPGGQQESGPAPRTVVRVTGPEQA
jgi:DNA-binding transcriptional regulator YhcF (GntR family)